MSKSRHEMRNGLPANSQQLHCVWWRLRTGLEKCLLYFWILFSILFFGLCTAFIVFVSIQYYSNKPSVCLTKPCLNAASQIMEYMDESVSPCHDFYRFSCGKWLQSKVIPDDSYSVSAFSATQDMIDYKLKNLLKETLKPIDSKTVKNMKTMYNSCVYLKFGFETLINYLKLLGNWPLIEGNKWNESNFDFIQSIEQLREFGFKQQFFFQLRVAPDYKHNTNHSIYLTEPEFNSLTKRRLINKSSAKLKYYLEFMVKIAVLLGADKNRARLEFKEVIKLESLLIMALRNYDSYQYTTIRELDAIAPNDWLDLINGVLLLNQTIDEDESIIVLNMKCLKALNKVFVTYMQKYKRVLANFMIWEIVLQSIRTLDNRFTNLENEFYAKTQLTKRNPMHWKTCLNLISVHMKAGLTSFYLINEPMKEKIRHKTIQIYETLLSTLKKKIAEIDWIDDETRDNAMYKIKYFNHFIGYTSELLNQNKIDQVYESLETLKSDDLFENVLKLQKWNLDIEYLKLHSFNDRNDWQKILTPAVVNAYYSPYINSIKVPIWILNGIFFNPNRPNYINYGALGWILGHELIHPFDNIGGRFDKQGNFRDWWDVETKQKFKTKTECFVNQYKNYNRFNITQRSTLSENIADNEGIDVAFRGYQEYINNNGEELPLPGLNYTAKQLFWISAANIWCSKYTPEGFRYYIANSIHSLSKYRVLVSFSNSEEFSKVFNCKESDRMNPKHKCKVF